MLLLTLLVVGSLSVSALPVHDHPDRVIRLPGAPLLPDFPLYAGYLNASLHGGNDRIFYMLNEAIRVDPLTAPLVVWFNGGPGGSSLAGCFMENGPYRVTESGQRLEFNEFSWNQYANVLFIESPLGVGFSQHNGQENDIYANSYETVNFRLLRGQGMTLDDPTTAELNYHSLKEFMTNVHPRYSSRDFYLSGQSYAGVYVPFLSHRILSGIDAGDFENTNFRGFAIGNPTFEKETRIIGQATQFIAHGLLEHGYTDIVSTLSKRLDDGMEIDNIKLSHLESKMFNWLPKEFNFDILYNFVEHCLSADATEEGFHGTNAHKALSCYSKKALKSYLSREDVQRAIHMRNETSGKRSWSLINYDMVEHYNRPSNLLAIYSDIISSVKGAFRMLIYQGDTDLILPAMGTVMATERIAKQNNLTKQVVKNAWHFYGDYAGGRYCHARDDITLDVLTVRGAGHSVPTDAPAQAFQMINHFLFDELPEFDLFETRHIIDYSKPIKKH